MTNPTIYPDREAWLAARKNSIGASDVATALGLNPWESALTLWARKRGDLPEKEQTLAMRVGKHDEGLIAALYAEKTDSYLSDPGEFTVHAHPDYPWLTCTPDRFRCVEITGPVIPVELKRIGFNTAKKASEGDAPAWFQVQLQFQMHILGAPTGDIAALVGIGGGMRFEIFSYERSEKLFRAALPHLERFMECVRTGDMPDVDDSLSTANTLQALHPDDNGESVPLSPEALDAVRTHLELTAESRHIEAELRAANNIIKASIGGNTFGTGPDCRVSWKTQERKECITKASKFRVLRIKEMKEEKYCGD